MGELVRKWRQYCHILDQEAKGKGEREKLKREVKDIQAS